MIIFVKTCFRDFARCSSGRGPFFGVRLPFRRIGALTEIRTKSQGIWPLDRETPVVQPDLRAFSGVRRTNPAVGRGGSLPSRHSWFDAGTENGLQVANFQIINMIFFGTVDPQDDFGFALVSGRFFDRNGGDDLLIGIPGRTHAVAGPDTGAAVIVQSVISFADGFESGDTSAWTASLP